MFLLVFRILSTSGLYGFYVIMKGNDVMYMTLWVGAKIVKVYTC